MTSAAGIVWTDGGARRFEEVTVRQNDRATPGRGATVVLESEPGGRELAPVDLPQGAEILLSSETEDDVVDGLRAAGYPTRRVALLLIDESISPGDAVLSSIHKGILYLLNKSG